MLLDDARHEMAQFANVATVLPRHEKFLHGRIEIEFVNEDELHRLYERLTGE